jgi:hypothetical protein
MKRVSFLVGCLCLCALATLPAHAFTAKELTINVLPDGDAQIRMQYELSFPEQFAVFLRVADPAAELKRGLEDNLNKPVAVLRFESTSAEVIIPAFATIVNDGETVTMITPALSFAEAQKVMNQYWFAPFISPDFSPQVTQVVFPDGYRAGFYDTISIPFVSHQLAP